MAIAVKCHCGKKFKVKDHLAGRKVRCPACKGPLRIPGTRKPVAVTQDSSSLDDEPHDHDSVSEEEAEKALLRFEEAQKNKSRSAEEEAAYQEEHNRLIAAYDQLAGKGGKDKGKKKQEVAPGKPKKAGFFTKLADHIGAICGTLAFKYVFYAVLLAGGVMGSIYGVKFLYTYMNDTTAAPKSREVQRDEIYKKIEAAIQAKKWGDANEGLSELRQLIPNIEKSGKYKALKAQIDKGAEKS